MCNIKLDDCGAQKNTLFTKARIWVEFDMGEVGGTAWCVVYEQALFLPREQAGNVALGK